MLLFLLVLLQLTSICRAQEPISMTDTTDIVQGPSISYGGDWPTTSVTIDPITYTVSAVPAGVPTTTSTPSPIESFSASPREPDSPNFPAIAPQPSVPETSSVWSGSDSANGNPADGLKTTLVVVESCTTLTIVTDAPQTTNLTRSDSGPSTISETQSSIGPTITCTCDSSTSTTRKGLPAAAIGAIVGSLLGATFLGILFVLWFMKRKGKRGFNKLEEGTANNPPAPRNGITPFILSSPEPQNLAIPNSKQRAMQEALRPISPLTSPVTSIGESWTLAESILSR